MHYLLTTTGYGRHDSFHFTEKDNKAQDEISQCVRGEGRKGTALFYIKDGASNHRLKNCMVNAGPRETHNFVGHKKSSHTSQLSLQKSTALLSLKEGNFHHGWQMGYLGV